MRKSLRIVIGLVWFAALSATWVGCSGASAPVPGDGGGGGTIPAAPAPPVEIPSFLRFPASIGIDTTSLTDPEGELSAFKTQVGDDFAFFIGVGPFFVDISLQTVDVIRDIFDQVNIPVSPDVTQFAGQTTSPEDNLKFDFGDFDNQGCTGCTCPVGCNLAACPSEATPDQLKPVCYRIWRDPDGDGTYERFVAGRFDQLTVPDNPDTSEDETNRGSGNFTAREEGTALNSLSVDVGASYDFIDPLDALAEIFVRLEDTSNQTITAHIELTQEGGTTEADSIKTIKVTEDASLAGAEQENFLKYIGRFRDEDPFWSGSVISTIEFPEPGPGEPGSGNGPIPPTSFDSVCANTISGLGVLQANCLDLGIDVTGEEFIRFLELDDVLLPDESVFPLTPP